MSAKYNKNFFKIVMTTIIAITLLILFTFGIHIILNFGRYVGTVGRYAIEGNVCNL